MSKKSDQPEKSSQKTEAKKAKNEAAVAAAEATTPLRVEIHFPSITDLKQAIVFDNDGNLLIRLQFTAPVNQYEIFRLVNLLKQPHGSLFATIGSPQSAMDFKFSREGKVEILKAELAQDRAKAKLPASTMPPEPTDEKGVKPLELVEIGFNHLPEEEKPFGVIIDFISDGTGKTHTVAGRGKSATEAVIAGLKATEYFPDQMKEPKLFVMALQKTKETPARIKAIRALEVGSFDVNEDKGKEGDTETKGD